ncbi:MAG: ABC transporter substrate-binding protein, partial [Actinomycetes bacterium]
SNSTGDFAILIGIKKGYFAEEGLDVNGIVFDSGGKMIAPLGSGEIDVATGIEMAVAYFAKQLGLR